MSVARPARQPAEIQNARNVLGLERRQGCQDRAVVGGLASYLANWRGRVAKVGDGALLALAERVVALLDGYADLPTDRRAARLDEALALLEGGRGCRPRPPASGERLQGAGEPIWSLGSRSALPCRDVSPSPLEGEGVGG